MQLELWRNLAHEIDNYVVEERNPYLDGGRHALLIGISQVQVGEEGLLIHVEHLIHEVQGSGCAEVLLEHQIGWPRCAKHVRVEETAQLHAIQIRTHADVLVLWGET